MEVLVSAIIKSNNKILLIRRRAASGRPKAFWELPGGPLVEGDISLEHAVIRSVYAELGISIFTTGRWFSNAYKADIYIVLSAELCDARDAYHLKHGDAILDYKWATIEDALELNTTPLTIDRISSVLQYA